MTIHQSDCGLCNSGKGPKRRDERVRRLNFSGPFKDLETAERLARKLGYEVIVDSCCLPPDVKSWKYKSYHKRFTVEELDESTITLEELLHRRLLQLYVIYRDTFDVVPPRLLGTIRELGGLLFARVILRIPLDDQVGFRVTTDQGDVDLGIERLILSEKFRVLFSKSEVAIARARLKDSLK